MSNLEEALIREELLVDSVSGHRTWDDYCEQASLWEDGSQRNGEDYERPKNGTNSTNGIR